MKISLSTAGALVLMGSGVSGQSATSCYSGAQCGAANPVTNTVSQNAGLCNVNSIFCWPGSANPKCASNSCSGKMLYLYGNGPDTAITGCDTQNICAGTSCGTSNCNSPDAYVRGCFSGTQCGAKSTVTLMDSDYAPVNSKCYSMSADCTETPMLPYCTQGLHTCNSNSFVWFGYVNETNLATFKTQMAESNTANSNIKAQISLCSTNRCNQGTPAPVPTIDLVAPVSSSSSTESTSSKPNASGSIYQTGSVLVLTCAVIVGLVGVFAS